MEPTSCDGRKDKSNSLRQVTLVFLLIVELTLTTFFFTAVTKPDRHTVKPSSELPTQKVQRHNKMKLLIAVAVLATTGYAAPQPQEGTEATAASAPSQLQDENIVIGAPVPLGDLESASTSIPPLADTPSATASVPAAPDASAPPELPEGAFAVGAGTPDAGPGSGSGSETAPEVVDQQLPAAAGATGAPLPGVDVSGLSTEGVTTVETVVDRFLTYVSGPTVFTTNGAVYSVTGAGTVTVTDCPCTITTVSFVPFSSLLTAALACLLSLQLLGFHSTPSVSLSLDWA